VRLFTQPPSEEEARSYGLTVEEASGPPVEVWPDNIRSVEVFVDLMTQWRCAGMAGVRIGLDYAVLPVVFGIRGIPKKQWPALFDDLGVMEVAVLNMPQKK
jgi:hypothetical protein